MMSCFVVRRVFNELLIIVNGNSKNDYLSYPRPVELPFNSHSQKKEHTPFRGFLFILKLLFTQCQQFQFAVSEMLRNISSLLD